MTTDTVRAAFSADPTSFSPLLQRGRDDAFAQQLLYDTLIRRDSGKLVPGLATKWDLSPTGGTITVRKDAKCSDGTPITPTVVADSLKAFSTPKTGSAFVGQVFGSQPTSITPDDGAGTVTITLNKPFADLATGLAHAATGIICPAGLKDPEGLKTGTATGGTSGPYTLTKAQHGTQYEMTLRSDYNGWAQYQTSVAGAPPKKIEFAVVGNQTTLANDMITGGRDVGFFTGAESDRVSKQPDMATASFPAASLFLMFNMRPGNIFVDPAVRKAVAQAVDRAGFNQAASSGQGKLQSSIALPNAQCANKDESIIIKTDQAAAKDVLVGKKIRILSSLAFGQNGAAGSYVAEALRAAGAEVELSNVDNGTWVTNGTQKVDSWDLTFMAASFANLNSFLASVSGPAVENAGLNWTGAEHPDVAEPAAKAEATADEGARCELFAQAEKAAITNVYAAPLSTLPSLAASRAGFSLSVLDGIVDFQTLRVTK